MYNKLDSLITNLFLVYIFVIQKYKPNIGTREYDILHLYLVGVLKHPFISLYNLDIISSPSDNTVSHQ